MIDAPGIYQISAAEYHADPVVQPSLSASIANVLINQSAAHARICHPRLCVDYKRDEDSRMDLGSAAHALLLEQDGSSIVFIAANDWRTNAAKEARDEARNAGKLPVLTRYEGVLHEMVRVAREAVEQSEFAGLVLGKIGKAEQTVVWKEGDVWCRARHDWLSTDLRDFEPNVSITFDYKSAASAAPNAFIKQIGNMGYDVSAEFYLRGLMATDGRIFDYVFLAQEIEPPFACSLHTLGNAYREIAEEKVERAIKLWAECMSTGHFPAYDLRLHHAEPPPWELHAYEQRMGMT